MAKIVFTEEHRHNLCLAARARKHKPHSEETKRKIGLGNLGKTLSREARLKISASRKDKYGGDKNPAWKGGRRLAYGYMLVHSPEHPYKNGTGYVREHRLVMEQHLGRYLAPKEVVHHLNGSRADNRIENLKLFSSQEEHVRYHGENK